ncbi:MAG: GNAT family N-acetyltransferase [Pseudomonadota bacterium]
MAFLDLKQSDASLLSEVLRLNAEHEAETSPLNQDGLVALIDQCRFALARADGRACLLALAPGAAYGSANYAWFATRYQRFFYIDRVIVGAELRGRGVGRALYERVFAEAQSEDVPVLCEVNRVPPNPGSDAFHAAMGFGEVGRGVFAPGKAVRYLCRNASLTGPRG